MTSRGSSFGDVVYTTIGSSATLICPSCDRRCSEIYRLHDGAGCWKCLRDERDDDA